MCAQEAITASLHYAEVVAALGVLAPGGGLLLKAFTLLEHSAFALLFILGCLFEQVRLAVSHARLSIIPFLAHPHNRNGAHKCSSRCGMLRTLILAQLIMRIWLSRCVVCPVFSSLAPQLPPRAPHLDGEALFRARPRELSQSPGAVALHLPQSELTLSHLTGGVCAHVAVAPLPPLRPGLHKPATSTSHNHVTRSLPKLAGRSQSHCKLVGLDLRR